MKKPRHEYSSTQVNLPKDFAAKIIRWGKEHVPQEDVFRDPNDPSFGRETEIHVTVLYGLIDSSPDEVREFVAGQEQFDVTLGKVNVFDTHGQFDVVKIDAQGEGLFKLNKLLKSNFRYSSNFPTYRPHVTIAYTRKGKGGAHSGDDSFVGEKFHVEEIVFSSRNGSKHLLPLKSSKPS
jgi:2'-5' RNA ligase